MQKLNKLSLISSTSVNAHKLKHSLQKKYVFVEVHESDVIIVLGGDGTLLRAIHNYMYLNIPFFGINVGSLGFLMNSYNFEDLFYTIHCSIESILHPLLMKITLVNGLVKEAIAINEVSIFRRTNQSAKFNIKVNEIERIKEIISDGIIVATSVGSAAYNFSAGGPILPLYANVLAITPISVFRPKRWKGAILPLSSTITFEIFEYQKRPVTILADFSEFLDVQSVSVESINNKSIKLLYNRDCSLENKLISEQFDL